MKEFKPELLLSLKHYSKEKLIQDIVSGVIVAIVALPLSIALALASGVSPEQGLYTAIVAGFVISAFGGSKVQIAGPTAAFATIVAGIVVKNGMDGLIIATILAGIILIIMGLCKMGSLIKFIPSTITIGFTAGIAVTIAIGQLKDFLGLTFVNSPIETMDKAKEVINCIGTINYSTVLVGIIALAILILWPKVSQKIPASLIAVLGTAAIVKIFKMNVYTIGDLYTISSSAPHFALPNFSFDTVQAVLPDAFVIAILAAIESLLSAVVADDMIGATHNSNMELVAQGLGNTASALFGGIPATGAIARTAANIKNGGRTPIAGMVHSVALLLVLVLLMPYAALIPMPCIAAILFQVAYNMSGWRNVVKTVKTAPKSDIIVLVTTFTLTVVFDLVIAIGVGMTLACLLFMKRMADVAHIREWNYNDDDERSKSVPEHIIVYEVHGPMFFGAADKIPHSIDKENKTAIIIRMKGVPAIDITAMNSLVSLFNDCRKQKIHVIFSHVNKQPMSVFKKCGFVEMVGEESFKANIDEALEFSMNYKKN